MIGRGRSRPALASLPYLNDWGREFHGHDDVRDGRIASLRIS